MKKNLNFISRHLVAISVVILWLKTVIITWTQFDVTLNTWQDVLLLIMGPLGIIMILMGISFLFSKQVRPVIFIVAYFLISSLLYANLLYYRFYIDFVTVSVLLQLSNVGGLGPSTAELISPFDLLIIADIGVIIYLLIRMYRKNKTMHMPQKRNYAMTGLVSIALTFSIAMWNNPYLLTTGYDRDQMVQQIGLYNYQIVNLIDGLQAPLMKVAADEKVAIKTAEDVQPDGIRRSENFGLAQGKNLVLISLESTQNFVINKQINGEEITPFLNDLVKESFYFPNIYDQTAQGKTSDAEFMVDTGLYPLPSGSVNVRRPENHFESLPKVLKRTGDYKIFAFHGNDASFWNRDQMYQSLGYDHYFSKKDYKVTEDNSVNYGIKDIPFLKQSLKKMNNLPEPFMAKLILMTNHFPFLLEDKDQFISPADTSVEVVNRYITTVNYQDKALEQFISSMKEKGLYENSIFVFYGDHYGISRKYEQGVHELLGQEQNPLNHLDLQKIPLIIHIPGQTGKEIKTVGGEIDIHATLLDLLGIPAEEHITLSRNLFTRNEEQPVVFRNGDIVTEKYASIDRKCYNKESGEVIETSACEKYLEIGRQELQLSDELIFGDLLRFVK
ncbi:phosphoglycerol transferase [Virgibacillus halodenitrificans]|uniref:Phosphoglycerol transferase n=1 Tax=Virgibacillus halodenitrificans TaxID=1482 RepID=A0AAC9IZK7_VIRHA|nr:LTA synthase family protein [Virgibacillus halodenitrificans]APC47892.1 phosphoglycerol transferase [Virgibacillus halodenitrificans]